LSIATSHAIRSDGPVMLRNRVVGIGSPHGDDSIGWLLIDRLRSRLDVRAELFAGTPNRLADWAQDCDRLIVVDAARVDLPEGNVLRFVWPDPRIFAGSLSSTHGLGVAESLQLADVLGRLPACVVVFVLSARRFEVGASPSETALAGLDALERSVLVELARPV
jgi:hydrogenase maturation protease